MRKIIAKNLNDVLAALPPKRRAKVEQRAGELATLKDLRLPVLLDHIAQQPAAKGRVASTKPASM